MFVLQCKHIVMRTDGRDGTRVRKSGCGNKER